MNKTGIFFILCLIGILNQNISIAQTNPEDISENFFSILKVHGIELAYDYLYSDNRAIDNNEDLINDSKHKLTLITKEIGDYHGYELISKEETGKSYVKLSFLLKYDKSPLKFTIIYYMPDNTWKVLDINYTRNIDDKTPMIRQLPLRNIR